MSRALLACVVVDDLIRSIVITRANRLPGQFFCFQAEDRIRDYKVTGVQTCALPICLPEGTLYVAGRSGDGAVDDSRRIAEFVYRNLGFLTNVTTTLDTHFAYQIFSPSFWIDEDGQQPAPFRAVTADEVKAGKLRPNPAVAGWLCGGNLSWLGREVVHYCEELERAGKYQLYLWPPHCLLGSDGHALVGVLQEAR